MVVTHPAKRRPRLISQFKQEMFGLNNGLLFHNLAHAYKPDSCAQDSVYKMMYAPSHHSQYKWPPEPQGDSTSPDLPSPPPAPAAATRKTFCTQNDTFGRYRVYSGQPTTIPDVEAPMSVILPKHPSDCTALLVRSVKEIIYPCPNISTFYVQAHHWLRGNTKSLNDRERLCDEVLARPDFNPRDVVGYSFKTLDKQLCESAKTRNTFCPPSEGWSSVSLSLEIPPIRQTAAMLKRRTTPLPKQYLAVPGLRSRKLTDIVYQAFSKNNPKTFHYKPYTEYYEPPGDRELEFEFLGKFIPPRRCLKPTKRFSASKLPILSANIPVVLHI
ncbi:hypothetical protein OPQ81_004993 [Rhizoctonia solani]|nr:hypothetical protein OPQ81_004993 [Rhizoctonia solani]